MKRFVLINPARALQDDNIWSTINSITPPLGLALLAALIERHGGHCDIIDANALDIFSPAEVFDLITEAPDYIGLTATTPEAHTILELSAQARKRFPEAKVIFGGVHPTIFHEQLVQTDACDMVVRGEGEFPVIALAEGKPFAEVPNLTWRDANGQTVVNPMTEEFVDLMDMPFPAYEKLPMKRYRSALGAARRTPSIGMITSRGCPGKCTFCYSGMFGSRIRMLTAQRMVEHIKRLQQEYGIREISFYDDTFTTNRKRVEAFCELLISEGVDVSWSCFARADTVSPELLTLMKRAGCHQVGYGFESADEAVLKAINKKITTSKVAEAAAWTNAAGLDVRGAFMLGNFGESEATMAHTIEYSKKLGIKYAMYNITTPYPGTVLYAEAKAKGLIRHEDWSRYDLSHAVLDLPGLPPELVERYYSKAYREFYFRPGYALKRLVSLRSWFEFKTHFAVALGIMKIILGKMKGALS